jgi:small-conductance mechanosensitive channel
MGWQAVLLEPAKVVLSQISQFLISVLLVVIILIIGWMISKLIRTLVTRVLKALKLDDLSERIDLDNLLAKGGIQYSLSELIGMICYWLALLITFVVAINAIGLTVAADLLNKVVLYIPNIIAAIFILILGMFVASLLKNIVNTGAINTGISQANLLGRIVEVIVIVFAIAIALQQLNIRATVIELAISIVLASIGLAVAIAFGLGCKDIAARHMSDWLEKLKSKK